MRTPFKLNRLAAATIGLSMTLTIGCASHPQAAVPVKANPVIVKLVGRHETITITTGPTGPLYTIIDAQGKLLVANVTLSDLRKQNPDLYKFYAPTFSAVGSADASVWAAE